MEAKALNWILIGYIFEIWKYRKEEDKEYKSWRRIMSKCRYWAGSIQLEYAEWL